MSVDVDRAVRYNRARAPLALLDQSTWQMVSPATSAGVEWVARHQRLLGEKVDGALGPDTKAALQRRYGPLDEQRHTRHPLPVFVSRWGYDHAHSPDDLDWPTRSPAFEQATDDGSWQSGMVRLVAGWSPSSRTWSRTPDSYISLDGGSFGLAHYWGAAAAPLISRLVTELPCLSREAFGELVDLVVDVEPLAEHLGRRRGKAPHDARLNDIVAGWRWLARQPEAIALQIHLWLADKVAEGRELARQHGWSDALAGDDGGRILAACVRLANSGSGNARRYIARAGATVGWTAPTMILLEWVYRAGRNDGGYGHPDRWQRITTWREFRGPAPGSLEHASAGATA